MSKREFESEEENFNEFFSCELDNKNQHILHNTKILPCGNKACLQCIELNLQNNELNCSFFNCNHKHLIADVSNLIDDIRTEYLIQKNAKSITKNILTNINEKYKKLESCLNECLTNQSEKITVIEEEIVTRIDFLKMELDKLKTTLLERAQSIKQTNEDKFKSEFEEIKINCLTFLNSIENLNERDKDAWMGVKENVYKCDQLLIGLKQFTRNMNETLSNISINVDDWLSNKGQITKVATVPITPPLNPSISIKAELVQTTENDESSSINDSFIEENIPLKIIRTVKGNPKLSYGGFLYLKATQGTKSEYFRWVCVKRSSLKCKAYVRTHGYNGPVTIHNEHTHGQRVAYIPHSKPKLGYSTENDDEENSVSTQDEDFNEEELNQTDLNITQSEDDKFPLNISETRQGMPKLLHNGYTYTRQNSNLVKSTIFRWKCACRATFDCPSRVITNGYFGPVTMTVEHSHPPPNYNDGTLFLSLSGLNETNDNDISETRNLNKRKSN